MATTIVVWVLIDIPLYILFESVIARSLVSIAIGYLLGKLIVGSFSSVSLHDGAMQKTEHMPLSDR